MELSFPLGYFVCERVFEWMCVSVCLNGCVGMGSVSLTCRGVVVIFDGVNICICVYVGV